MYFISYGLGGGPEAQRIWKRNAFWKGRGRVKRVYTNLCCLGTSRARRREQRSRKGRKALSRSVENKKKVSAGGVVGRAQFGILVDGHIEQTKNRPRTKGSSIPKTKKAHTC